MPLDDHAEDLHWQAVHLRSISAGLEEAIADGTSETDAYFHVRYAIDGLAEYRELVERMLRDLDRSAARSPSR